MKKLSLILIGLLLVPTLFLTSCDRGDDLTTGGVTAEPTFTLLKEYMIDNQLDINNVISNPAGIKFVVGAPALADYDAAAFKVKYYIMDIRSANSYGTSHIDGAINVAFGDILTQAANKGNKQLLVVCYTGQTACYATALLRMYGHPNAQALKWGMTGWSETTDSWTAKVGDVGSDSSNWSYGSAPALGIYSDPVLSSLSVDGAEILRKRVEDVVAAGFKTASNADVVASPSDYFINNFFSETDYTGFGHISGAHRISPLTLANGEYKNLDDSAKVVTYCYTGQTSAVVTACLRVLGYDAYSLTFGMNGLNHSSSQWASNHWGVDSHAKGLPLVN
ncbi:MAG: rhodanese-like domain-containing protein [Lutibacter sp.]|uniref:rhodanese-like domain-containing protein n=1 Tax=Lutibacter sp. TaxID=1925666 RepID=UPI00385CDCC0